MKARPFKLNHRMDGNCIEIWEGTPDDPESDLLLHVHISYIPAIRAKLTELLGKTK